ncbi:MAG TPA: porin [Lysobacter sp.]|nr:porin [Lysobacter sp.]
MRSNLLATAIAIGLGLAAVAPAHAADDTASQLAAMKAQIAALQAQLEDLQARTDAQSEVNVTQAKAIEAAQATNTKSDALAKLVNDTKLSGRMYYDFSHIDAEDNGVKTSATGTGFDIKRFYLGVDHKFNDTWSVNLTTDFQYSSAIGATEIYIKKAYLEGKFSDAFTMRLGSTDLPWVPFAENAYGYRYIENTLVDRLKYGTSADWGVHASGATGSGMFNYAVAMINGAGYKNPSRSKGVDFEGRIGFAPVEGMTIGLGAYSGKLGKETETVDVPHTANRIDALIAYATPNFRVGAEWFSAKDWNVAQVDEDKADGYSVFGNVALGGNGINLFARYDSANTSKDIDPSLKNTYYNLGVEFPIMKGLKIAPVYKYTKLENDTGVDLVTKELGVWGEFRF